MSLAERLDKKVLALFVKVVVGSLFLFLVFRKLNFQEVDISTHFNYYYFLLFLLFTFCSLFVMTLRWYLLIRKIADISVFQLLNVYWISNLVGVVAFGFIGSETYKVAAFKKNRGAIFVSSLQDRILSLIFLSIFTLGSLFLLYSQITYIYLIIGMAMLSTLATTIMGRRLIVIFGNIFRNQVWSLGLNTTEVLIHSILTFIFTVTFFLRFVVVFWSFNEPISIELFNIIPLIILITSIPISFQGLGPREFIFVTYSGMLGINAETGFTLSIYFLLYSLIFKAIGVAPLVLNKNLSWIE